MPERYNIGNPAGVPGAAGIIRPKRESLTRATLDAEGAGAAPAASLRRSQTDAGDGNPGDTSPHSDRTADGASPQAEPSQLVRVRPVILDSVIGDGTGSARPDPQSAQRDEGSEPQRVLSVGGNDGRVPPGDEGELGAGGDASMDRERAMGILTTIAAVTEADFAAQDSQNHIGGHTFEEIQQAATIRADEIFEERGFIPHFLGSTFIFKNTPQRQAELQMIGGPGAAIILELHDARMAGVRMPRRLASFRLPLTTEPSDYLLYADNTTPGQPEQQYQRFFDGTPVTAEDNLGIFRGLQFFAENLTGWKKQNFITLPKHANAQEEKGAATEPVAQAPVRAWPEATLPERMGRIPDGPEVYQQRIIELAEHPDPGLFDLRNLFDGGERDGLDYEPMPQEGDRTPFSVIINSVPRRHDAPPASEMRERVEENIASIQDAVGDGRHATLFYPAHGEDIARVLTAYDTDHLILIDADPERRGSAERQLRELGIEPTVTFSDSKRREIAYELNGRQRRITEVIDDARLYTPGDFDHNQVDVYHIQASMDAGEPLTKDGIVYGGELTPAIYEMVAEGGFFVIEERRLNMGNNFFISPSLIALIGLEEKEITKRHPFTVLSQDSYMAEKLERPKTGYIYQKVRTVSTQAMNVFEKAAYADTYMQYDFDRFEDGKWKHLGLNEKNDMDVYAGVRQKYEKWQEDVTAYAGRFAQAGIDQDLIDAYTTEMLKGFENRILSMQTQMRELLEVHDQAKAMAATGVDQQQILKLLGFTITDGQIIGESSRGPLVRQLFMSGQEKSTETYDIVEQFAHADFQAFFAE